MSLPRLLYIGDVPIEASCHGSALLHRLLSDYPYDRLTIIETARASDPQRRLPKVNYSFHPIGKARWLNTRFHPYAVVWFTQAGKRLAPKIAQSVNGVGFESVLTVADGFGWLAAANIAGERKVPLHLIVHDDLPTVAGVAPRFRKWFDGQFAGVYRQAQSRLCVSPAMSRIYQQRYGQPAQVIYPSWAVDRPGFDAPPTVLFNNDKPFTIAFAGTVSYNGYVKALIALQKALKSVEGRLLIFGSLTADVARQIGLDAPGTKICGLVSSGELLTRLRDEADVLFVPMSFYESDRDNMQMAFPSKLADYTATGLPLLIYGPSYCSAVVWARDNPGVAEIVQAEADLGNAINCLASNPDRRIALGKRALDVGRKYFTHDQAQRVFHSAISV